jgi:hypothetical protein
MRQFLPSEAVGTEADAEKPEEHRVVPCGPLQEIANLSEHGYFPFFIGGLAFIGLLP